MRHDKLVRATLAIGAVFTVAAIVFAASRGPSPTGTPASTDASSSPHVSGTAADRPPAVAPEGAAYFHDRCGRCHDGGDFSTWARKHPDPGERGRWLERVLGSHASPPLEERAAILVYIQQEIAGASE